MKVDIPPEIINNIGTLYFKLGDMEKAKVFSVRIKEYTLFCKRNFALHSRVFVNDSRAFANGSQTFVNGS